MEQTTIQNLSFELGESKILFKKYFRPGKKIILIRLHGDEHDASAVGQWWVETHGGSFLDIQNPTRELQFDLKGKTWTVDPNRIFSAEGIKKTLSSFGCSPVPYTVNAVKEFSTQVLNQFFGKTHLIALHNNMQFNITLYEKEGELALAAKDVHRNMNEDPHDFVLVTQKKDFDALKKLDVNVVWENKDVSDHPGSVSEFCIAKGMRYFNIEAKQGHLEQQKKLLEKVASLIL